MATPARAQSSSSCAVPPPTPQAPTSSPLRKIGTAPWQDNGEAAEAAREEGQMTLRVIYSADIASAPSSGFNAYLFTHGGHGAIWRDGLCMPFVPTAAFRATSRRTTFSRSGWIIDGRYLGNVASPIRHGGPMCCGSGVRRRPKRSFRPSLPQLHRSASLDQLCRWPVAAAGPCRS